MKVKAFLVVTLLVGACGFNDGTGGGDDGPGSRCGDGTMDSGEECDDGNNGAGDGCSATCTSELAVTCGDGELDPPLEECDDGGAIDGDGCSAACQLEPVGQTCGNTLDPGEKCDDGNRANGDGCNSTCNFLTTVTELTAAVPGTTITSDGTHLYVYGSNGNCQIHRAAIAQCAQGNCVFTPFVGAGGCGTPQADGPGATAVLGSGNSGLAFGAGKLFFSDEHTVRAVDLLSSTLDVTTIAGDHNRCGHLDGAGNMAVMSDVRGLTFYNGLIYSVDGNMATLRSIDPTSGQVITLAGQSPNDNSGTSYNCNVNLCCGSNATPSDGLGTAAIMMSPRYITQDNTGSVFMIDTNASAVRRYDTATTMLSTIVSGVGYVDGQAAAVRIDRPRGLTSDGTSLYFGEQDLHTVRQVEVGTATATTFVGVRGCAGPRNLMGGIGGDGTQSWASNCTAGAITTKPQFTVGSISMTFDYGTKSIYAIANGRLLRIE